MKSVIKWQTRTPKKEGKYLVTTKDGKVQLGVYIATLRHGYHWMLMREEDITAWYPLIEIKPYKE